MINWDTWVVKYKGRHWNYKQIAYKIHMSFKGMKGRIQRYENGGISKKELFATNAGQDLKIRLSDGSEWTIYQIMEVSGCDYELIRRRMSDIRLGRMKEEVLFTQKSKRGGVFRPKLEKDKMPPERQTALRELQNETQSEAYRRQEKYFPLYDTPTFQKKHK
jgi:hypothetical protein